MRKLEKYPMFGYQMSQAKEAVFAFHQFFNKEKFDVIVELGTGSGTLSMFFAFYIFTIDGELHTFDIKKTRFKEKIEKLNGYVYNTNIMENKDFIIDLLSQDKRVLLICDNGNKPLEVNTFSSYLKSGDFIMAHDFFYNKNKTGNLWNCEISHDKIKNTIDKNNLTYQYRNLFDDVFWCCLRKN